MKPNNLVAKSMAMIIPFSIFQDTALQNTPFTIALASPAALFLLFATIFEFFTHYTYYTSGFRIKTWVIFIALVYISLNIIYANYFGTVFFGENLYLKGFKSAILLVALLLTYWFFKRYFLVSISFWLKISALIAFAGLAIDLLFHDQLINNWWLHYGINDLKFDIILDDRPRGFSSESSTLGVTLLITGLLASWSSRLKVSRYLWIIITFCALLFTGSKGDIIVLSSSLLLSFSIVNRHRFKQSTIGLIILFLLVLAFIFGTSFVWLPVINDVVLSPLQEDLYMYTSVATRSTMTLSAVINIFENPLGVGLTGYMPALVDKIDQASELAATLLNSNLNLSEVTKYLVEESDYAIGAKNFLFDNGVVFGIPFIVFWFYFNLSLIRRLSVLRDTISLTLLMSMFIAFTLYLPGVNMYTAAAAYGILSSRMYQLR